MKNSAVLLLLAMSLISSHAARPTKEFPLWSEGAPAAKGEQAHDIPTLIPLWPEADKATGAAMIICPGGGYGALMMDYEGTHFARWLNEHGVAGFVLKYRLGRHEWELNPNKIGILGTSAGGHLAATATVHFDAGDAASKDNINRVSSRPDLAILCYPVITMGEFTHKGSRRNLLGDTPSKELLDMLSCEKQVTRETPPTFIFHTVADKAVPVENALLFASALRRHKAPFDLHIYQEGPHGVGLGSRDYNPAKRHPWTKDCTFWLKLQGFVK